MTNLNKKILEMIRNSEGHLTAEQAFLLAKSQDINVSMASIYRILSKLADEGYIKKISIPGQVDLFDKTITAHAHLKCKKCGKVKDLHLDNFEHILCQETGIAEIDDYSLCIDYICEDCLKKEEIK